MEWKKIFIIDPQKTKVNQMTYRYVKTSLLPECCRLYPVILSSLKTVLHHIANIVLRFVTRGLFCLYHGQYESVLDENS